MIKSIKTDRGIAANQLHTEAEEKKYLAESILAQQPGGLRLHSRPAQAIADNQIDTKTEEKEFISVNGQ